MVRGTATWTTRQEQRLGWRVRPSNNVNAGQEGTHQLLKGRAPSGHVPQETLQVVVSTRAAFDTRRVVRTGAVELGKWDLLAFPEDDHPNIAPALLTGATAKHPQRK